MPDATITSTASTFGTITGTFASDQSTITGTVTGVVVGTLDGSVGVPGIGIPDGGTTGQVLKKASNTSYDTVWGTDLASAAWGTITGTLSSQTDLQTALDAKAPLASPAFTGNPTAPTAALADNDTSIATTAFVQQELASGVAVAKNLEVYVRNQTGSTLTAGTIVYINGATGNRPTVTKAQANNDANSAQTFGFVKTSIANNGFGYVIVRGECENLDTQGLTEGAQLYLSPTTAGTWTTTKPSAPQHLVYVGIVVRAHPTQGVILVAIQNGYELNEIHDVLIDTPSNGQVLKYDAAQGLWINGTDSSGVAWGGITGSLSSQTDLQTALGLKYDASNPSGFIGDAPSDGSQYARKDGAWDVVTPATNFITSVQSPLAVTSGDLTVDLSAYETIANASATYYPNTNPSGFLDSSGVLSMLAPYAEINNPTFTGVPAAPTAAFDTNTTQIATTAFVINQGYVKASDANSTFAKLTGSNTLTGTNTFTGANLSFGTSTIGSTINIGSGATQTGVTKTVNIGTSGLAGSTTNITIGTSVVGATSTTALLGTTTGVTAAVDTNTTDLATTAFVIGQGYLKSATASSIYAPLASPALTGNVTITTNSTSPALVITQDGTGDVVQFKDVTSDTTYSFIDQNGKVNTVASTTTSAGFNVPHGTAPTSPVNGDIWTTTGNLWVRINGASQAVSLQGNSAQLSSNNIFTNASSTYGNSTATGTINVATGATISGATKAVNIGTGGVAGSTTAIIIGSTTGTSTTTLQGTTNGVTVAADTNSTALATTAYVVGQASSTSPVMDGSATVGTSLKYARADHVHPTDTSLAPLASPALTGTPTAPTASAGTNTTQIATTAFVTAAVPAFATVAQSRAATSTTTSMNPSVAAWQRMAPGTVDIARPSLTYTATGTMGGAGAGFLVSRMTLGTAGACSANFRTFGVSQIDQTYGLWSQSYRSYINFSKLIWCSGRFYTEDNINDPNVTVAFYCGKAQNSANGDLARAGFGWKFSGNATAGNRLFVVCAHNGTTLTTVTSSFAIVAQQYVDWDVVSNGSGTVTLYINGTQVATTTGGPTADTSYSGTAPVIWNEEMLTTGTSAGFNATFGRGRIYMAP